MSNIILEKQIFDLIKKQEFDEIYKMIKNKKITKLDFKDENYNYFIQYMVTFNRIDIIKLILEMKESINIRIDILDIDGRSILYNCIKYNNIDLILLLLEYDKTNIGISILDIPDRLGLTSLHYTVVFNNFTAFKLLLENKADPYIQSKAGMNVFITALTYKRNDMILYLIDNRYKINFTNNSGETLLQVAINYNNMDICKILLNSSITLKLDNNSSDYGLTALHQTIILDNIDIYILLLDRNVDVNMADFHGNLPLHYIFIYNRINYLNYIFKKQLQFNKTNINGETPLHILLDMPDIMDIDPIILDRIIMETDLNIQNNMGISCFAKIISNNLMNRFKDILAIKPLNFFITDLKLTDDIIDILVTSYYNMIQSNKDELILDWEKFCSTDNINDLKKIIKTNKTTSVEICKDMIREIIVKEKRTLPLINKINLHFDNGIYTNYCFYTGSPIDVLFGLILLKNDFSNSGLGVILDYPLTVNINLETYYKKIGLDYPYKLDFSNIEIIWSYMKMFFPSYFDDMILKYINNKDIYYIAIPIGIETATGSHANILFWDKKNNTIERFEPNGSNYPMGMNYNPELLDSLLFNKFTQYDPNIKYIPPYKFLPTIGFQIYENLETSKCKKIGDPNGFCAVWCIWWVYQRIININNMIPHDMIAHNMIEKIKIDGDSFKTIIRNFSKKITDIRDSYLKKVDIDINDWIVGNYSDNILDRLEKYIFKSLE
jgi:ankyrin repeat protein